MLDASVGTAAVARFSVGGWDLEAAAGARVGYARLRGEPDPTGAAGGSLSGAWGGPLLGAALLAPLSARLRLGLELESGVALPGVVGRVDGAPVLGVDGFWFRAGGLAQYDL